MVALDWYASGDVMGRGDVNIQTIYDMLRVKKNSEYLKDAYYGTDMNKFKELCGVEESFNFNVANNDETNKIITQYLEGIVKDRRGFIKFTNWIVVFNENDKTVSIKNFKKNENNGNQEDTLEDSIKITAEIIDSTGITIPNTHEQEMMSVRETNKWSIAYPKNDTNQKTDDDNSKLLHFLYDNIPQNIILPEIGNMDNIKADSLTKHFGKYWILRENDYNSLGFYYRDDQKNEMYSPQLTLNTVRYVSYARELIDPAKYVSYAQMF